MSKFKFECLESNYYTSAATRTTEFSADILETIVGEFDLFLKGCGYVYDGRLEIVNDYNELNDKLNQMAAEENAD